MTKRAPRKDQKRKFQRYHQWIRPDRTAALGVGGATNWHSHCSVIGGSVTSLAPCLAPSAVLFTTVLTTCRTTSSLPTTWEAGFLLALDIRHHMTFSPTSCLALTKNRTVSQSGTVLIELKVQRGKLVLPGTEICGRDKWIKHYFRCWSESFEDFHPCFSLSEAHARILHNPQPLVGEIRSQGNCRGVTKGCTHWEYVAWSLLEEK